ncbi:hypothetical protein C4D60_Mb09t25610 [Musa balbisiana]|uniref:K-box domain-containing protein n=1 Tax=Musa balbisiana TaxID=52838 RepID=A0A4S8IJT9_MUSBA|nr:hypothetical protein C4D60_Mb09t25610 [Musa balbisiana]
MSNTTHIPHLLDLQVTFHHTSETRNTLESCCGVPIMLKTLERYQKCNYGAPETNVISRETQSSQQEYLKLKARVEALQRSQRNLLGEDLGPLSIKELEQLERQLDASLRQIRSTREQMLCEANKALKRRVSSSLYFRPNLATSRKLCHGLNVTLGSWRRATKPPSNNCGIPTPTAGSNLNHRVTASSNP